MNYGITYFPTAGQLANTEVAWWYSYGNPQLWTTYQEAAKYLSERLMPHLHNMEAKVVPAARAFTCTVEAVEVFSGRRKVEGSLRPVRDNTKPTYEMLRIYIERNAPLSSGKLNLLPPEPKPGSSFTPRIKKVRT